MSDSQKEYKKKYDNNDKNRRYDSKNPFDGMRVPPQDIDSERALLGAIIISPESYYDIEDLIREKSFYAEKHRSIWIAMQELTGAKEPVDLISLNNKLKQKNELDQIGGSAYLAELSNFVASAANIKYYATILKKKELLRRLIEVSTKIADVSYEEKHEVEHILESAEKEGKEVKYENRKFRYLEAVWAHFHNGWHQAKMPLLRHDCARFR